MSWRLTDEIFTEIFWENLLSLGVPKYFEQHSSKGARIMRPFGRNTKTQTIFSAIAIMVGIFLVLITAPFITILGDKLFYGAVAGGFLIILGVVYLLDAQL